MTLRHLHHSRARIAARNVLWVVEEIGELPTEPGFYPFGDAYVFINSQVHIVGRLSGERIATAIRQRTLTGLYVVGARIVPRVNTWSDWVQCFKHAKLADFAKVLKLRLQSVSRGSYTGRCAERRWRC